MPSPPPSSESRIWAEWPTSPVDVYGRPLDDLTARPAVQKAAQRRVRGDQEQPDEPSARHASGQEHPEHGACVARANNADTGDEDTDDDDTDDDDTDDDDTDDEGTGERWRGCLLFTPDISYIEDRISDLHTLPPSHFDIAEIARRAMVLFGEDPPWLLEDVDVEFAEPDNSGCNCITLMHFPDEWTPEAEDVAAAVLDEWDKALDTAIEEVAPFPHERWMPFPAPPK